jgi:hypothetical protein
MAFKTFQNGFPLPASDLNNFLMRQSIAVFVDSSSRDAAITTPVEGQFAYLKASEDLVKYDGAAWVSAIPSPVTEVLAKTAAYTLLSSDTSNLITASGTFTITIPSATFSAGDRVDFINIGTGIITFAGSGVTVNSVDAALTIDTQWAGATFFFTSASAGVLIGKLA